MNILHTTQLCRSGLSPCLIVYVVETIEGAYIQSHVKPQRSTWSVVYEYIIIKATWEREQREMNEFFRAEALEKTKLYIVCTGQWLVRRIIISLFAKHRKDYLEASDV